MIGFNAAKFQQFLNRNSHRRAAPPDPNDVIRLKAIVIDLVSQLEGICQQFIRGDEDFIQ